MKEADTSFATVLNNLFSPMTRKRAKELGLTETEERKYVGRLSQEVEATGAMDKISLG
jgi:chromosome transmission fidelity protein 18